MRLINNIKNKLNSEIILILNPNPKAYVTLDLFPKKKWPLDLGLLFWLLIFKAVTLGMLHTWTFSASSLGKVDVSFTNSLFIRKSTCCFFHKKRKKPTLVLDLILPSQQLIWKKTPACVTLSSCYLLFINWVMWG